jgi:hypothetical protein
MATSATLRRMVLDRVVLTPTEGKTMDKRIITWQWGNNEQRDDVTTSRGFIIANHYNRNVPAYQQLVREAKKDFPALRDADIELGYVTDSTYCKNCTLISFPLPANTTREGYRAWDRFDFRY